VADAWFQSKDNLVGLEYSNEDGLWYLDNRVPVVLVKLVREF
jgi:hypothetical protein